MPKQKVSKKVCKIAESVYTPSKTEPSQDFWYSLYVLARMERRLTRERKYESSPMGKGTVRISKAAEKALIDACGLVYHTLIFVEKKGKK